MNATQKYDVTVIGAGIVGASCAFRLAQRGLSVAVIEAFGSHAEGSTGRSFASIRGQWADPFNIDLSWRSICSYRDFEAEHGVDVGYQPSGYLFLVPEEQWEQQLAAVELQRQHGVPVEVLDVKAAQALTPFDAHGIAGGTWGSADGQVDPHLITTSYLGMARAAGARVVYGSRVDAIVREGDEWHVSAGSSCLVSEFVVNAAGGWSGEVAALAGLSVPVAHSRRNVYGTASGVLDRNIPMTIDIGTGAYMRSEGTRLLYGGARPDEVDGYQTHVDWPWMESLLEIAVDRFPWLADMPLDRQACWAGTYENTPDHRAVIGPQPESPTWIDACGFSGHGVMQAPEVGRIVAEQIAEGSVKTYDISGLAVSRFDDIQLQSSESTLVF